MNRHGGVAKHGLGPRGGDGDGAAPEAVYGVANVPEMTGDVGVIHLEIGDGGVATRAPVDHVLATVDEPFFVQPHEDFAHGAGKAGIESETLTAPVAACAELDHLM